MYKIDRMEKDRAKQNSWERGKEVECVYNEIENLEFDGFDTTVRQHNISFRFIFYLFFFFIHNFVSSLAFFAYISNYPCPDFH